MAKYLVIVESPAKVKTVKKFLGSNYEVAASTEIYYDPGKGRIAGKSEKRSKKGR